MNKIDRRSFLKISATGAVATTFMSPLIDFTSSEKPEHSSVSVAITTGDNRADLAFRALQPYSKQIRHSIGNRRVAVELMGIDFGKIGYLNYCAQTSLGIADLSKIEIVGESISNHIKHYKLHENIEEQLIWMKPVS